MTTQNLQMSVSQWIGKDMCFSSKQNVNHLYEMHEGDIIFSANQGDSSMEDEDLQAIKKSRRFTARSNILKRWPVFR